MKYTVLVWKLEDIDYALRGLIKRGARNIRQTFPRPYAAEREFKLAEVSLEFETADAETIDGINKFLKPLYADDIISGWYCG